MVSGRSRLSNHGFSHERPLHEKADVGRKPSNDGSADKPAVRRNCNIHDFVENGTGMDGKEVNVFVTET
jgi:hypothetical protein